MTDKHPKHIPDPADHVSLGTRVGWGFGGLADNYIMNALNALFLIIYVQYFKMPPVLAGLALAVPRLFDAITDPLIGNISDNTRTRWGRRRPYLVVGAVLSAILLPLFWMPLGLGTATSEQWWTNGLFLYATVLGIFYALTYTLYVVPYTGLGYELTNDYDERTRVLAWRMYIGLLGSMTVPLLYRLVQLDRFGNEAHGAVIISIGLGVLIIVAGVIPAITCREHEEVLHQESIKFIPALKASFSHRAFVILLTAYIIIIVGLFSAGSLGGFLNIYYVCGGNKDFAGVLIAASGVVGAITSYASMFLLTAVSTRFEKKTAMLLGIGLAFTGAASLWWLYDPRWPMAQLLTVIVGCMGLQGCWLMISSMTADICDEDELKTGLRREAMFGAVDGLALKGGLAATALIGGVLIQLSGFNAEGVDQFEAQTIAEVIEPMRAWQTEDAEFLAATAEFERSAERFELISEDKSAVKEGSKWLVMWRLLKGEKLYFRWYEFDEALATYLQQVQSFAGRLPDSNPLHAELEAYQQAAEAGFVAQFEDQKQVAIKMKILLIAFQLGGLGLAAILFLFYPITRARSEETRRILDARKAEREEET